MKFTTAIITLSAHGALALPGLFSDHFSGEKYPVDSYPVDDDHPNPHPWIDHPWEAPGPNDVRAPCPMLNTLANHGYFPRDGKNLDRKTVVKGLWEGVAWNNKLANEAFDRALLVNPNHTSIDLDMLTKHNILEHDASLSRKDAHFGPADTFDPQTWKETVSYFPEKIINATHAVRARTARILTSVATNQDFVLSELGANFIFGETAQYIMTLGDKDKLEVPYEVVEYWIENERLPWHLGWRKQPGEGVTFETSLNSLKRLRAEMEEMGKNYMDGIDFHAN